VPGSGEPQIALGQTIQLLREANGLTQKDLAEEAGISLSALVHIESGQGDTSWGTVARLAKALDISMEAVADLHEAFVRREEEEGPPPP
jgi:transcriptional regulator with XRE-family HTH domain